MRCIDLLKKYNIGFEYLKQLLDNLGYVKVSSVNTIIDDADVATMEQLLVVIDNTKYNDAVLKLQRARLLYNRAIEQVQDAVELDINEYESWSTLKKTICFNRIVTKYRALIERHKLLQSLDYSEDRLLCLLNYQKEGRFEEIKKEEIESEEKERLAEEKRLERELNGPWYRAHKMSDIDDETAVMSALRGGYGDSLGY